LAPPSATGPAIEATNPQGHAKGDWQAATDGAFEALGNADPGRLLSPRDTTDAEQVAVINELSSHHWLTAPPPAIPDGRGDRGPRVTIVDVGNEAAMECCR
jgi:hypothetical protein